MDTPEPAVADEPTDAELTERLNTDAELTDSEQLAEQRGRDDHADGAAIKDNPFDSFDEPRQSNAWRDGWIKADKDGDDSKTPDADDDGDYRTTDEPEPDNDRQLNPGGYDDRELAAFDDYPFALCDPPGALAPAPLGGVTLSDTHQPWLLYRLDDYPRAIEAVRAHIDKCWRVRFRIQEWIDGERRSLEAEAQDNAELTNKAKRQGYVEERMASQPSITMHTRWLHLWKTEINRAEARVERLTSEMEMRQQHMWALMSDDFTPVRGFGTSANGGENSYGPAPEDELREVDEVTD